MNPTYDFSGKVAFVTGASQGIGLAAARAFAEAGAAVVLVATSEKVMHAAQDISAAGGRAIGLLCDVSDEGQVAAAVEQAVSTYGTLDIAFNNAGIQSPAADLADQSAEDFDRVVAINLRGVWACMKHELKHMRDQGSGAIINCSSVGGLVGSADYAAYSATKHGIIGMTKSAALTYAARGIRINAICPGTIDTPMVSAILEKQPAAMDELKRVQPVGRLGTADEIAAAVLWLASPAASFVHGAYLAVDGGYSAQ